MEGIAEPKVIACEVDVSATAVVPFRICVVVTATVADGTTSNPSEVDFTATSPDAVSG